MHPLSRAVRRGRDVAIQMLGIGLFFAIVVVVFEFKIDNFLSRDNIDGILATSAALGLVSVGQTFTIVSGGFDLSVGGIVPLSAVAYAAAPGGTVGGIVWACTVGVGVGAVNGTLVAKFGMNPLITTLATLSITGGLAYSVTDGVARNITSDGGGIFGEDAFAGLQYGVLLFLGIAVVATLALRVTTFGRRIYAVGGNREAARLAGIPCGLVAGSAYVISGLCSALGGVVIASQLLAAAPNAGTDTTLNSVAAVVLGGASLAGGIGGVGGTVLGVLLLGSISNGLSLLQISSFYQTIITGAILLLAIGFARIREVLPVAGPGLGRTVLPRQES